MPGCDEDDENDYRCGECGECTCGCGNCECTDEEKYGPGCTCEKCLPKE